MELCAIGPLRGRKTAPEDYWIIGQPRLLAPGYWLLATDCRQASYRCVTTATSPRPKRTRMYPFMQVR